MIPDKQFKDWLNLIPQLSKEQLLEFETAMKAVRSLSGPSSKENPASVPDDGGRYDWAVHVICKKAESMGLVSTKLDFLVSSLIKGHSYRQFCDRMRDLDTW